MVIFRLMPRVIVGVRLPRKAQVKSGVTLTNAGERLNTKAGVYEGRKCSTLLREHEPAPE